MSQISPITGPCSAPSYKIHEPQHPSQVSKARQGSLCRFPVVAMECPGVGNAGSRPTFLSSLVPAMGVSHQSDLLERVKSIGWVQACLHSLLAYVSRQWALGFPFWIMTVRATIMLWEAKICRLGQKRCQHSAL